MKAKLISVTRPFEDMTPEDLVVYCARVSNPKNQANLDTAPKLIKYLIEHKHWSPFELVHATVEVETSRAIASQILRHRSFTFQEFSQRYANVDELGQDYERVSPRRQDKTNRQNSIDDLSDTTKRAFQSRLEQVWTMAKHAYNESVQLGIAKESARFLLPLATTTRLYVCGSLRSFLHYLQVRLSPETQLEHRELANAIKVCLSDVFPVTMGTVFDDRET